MDLDGRIALVTGAASGIGRATAERLAGLGATVVLADLNLPGAQEAAATLGEAHRAVGLDVTDVGAWQHCVAGVVADLGRLDVVHLNAGVMSRPLGAPLRDDPLDWVTPEALRKVTSVNVDGVVLGIVATLPHLGQGAAVVITSSFAGVTGYAADPLYSMTKHAVIGLTRALAPSLDRRGVTINAICPKGIDTAIVPPDVRTPDRAFAPPSYIADVVVEVLESGANGGVWIAGGAGEPTWEYTYAPVDLPDPGR